MKIKHSGAIGDILYALPYIASLGTDIDFYVGELTYVRGLEGVNNGRAIGLSFPLATKLIEKNHSNYTALKRLLEAQPFIRNVYQYNEELGCLDLDTFRQSWTNISILDIVNKHFGYTGYVPGSPFIFNINKLPGFENTCVCARSPRYVVAGGERRYQETMQKIIAERNPSRFVFVGLDSEFEYFRTNICGDITHCKTNDILDVAEVINSCPYGIYNASAPIVLATGLNKFRYIEDPKSPVINSIVMNDGLELFF